MSTAAEAPSISIAQQYKLLRMWIAFDGHLKSLVDAYGKRLSHVLAPREIELAQERGWLCRPPEPVPAIADDFVVSILACAWGNDTTGKAYSPSTDFHVDYCPVPLVQYNHGRDDADTLIEGRSSIIGQVLSRDVKADGVWYQAKLDRSNQWAIRAWEAAKIGRCRVSSGSHHGFWVEEGDQITHWPVLEISLFHSAGTVRQPRHPYAVAVPASVSVSIPDTQPGEVPAALLWAIDRSLRCDPTLNELAAGIQQFVLEGA